MKQSGVSLPLWLLLLLVTLSLLSSPVNANNLNGVANSTVSSTATASSTWSATAATPGPGASVPKSTLLTVETEIPPEPTATESPAITSAPTTTSSVPATTGSTDNLAPQNGGSSSLSSVPDAIKSLHTFLTLVIPSFSPRFGRASATAVTDSSPPVPSDSGSQVASSVRLEPGTTHNDASDPSRTYDGKKLPLPAAKFQPIANMVTGTATVPPTATSLLSPLQSAIPTPSSVQQEPGPLHTAGSPSRAYDDPFKLPADQQIPQISSIYRINDRNDFAARDIPLDSYLPRSGSGIKPLRAGRKLFASQYTDSDEKARRFVLSSQAKRIGTFAFGPFRRWNYGAACVFNRFPDKWNPHTDPPRINDLVEQFQSAIATEHRKAEDHEIERQLSEETRLRQETVIKDYEHKNKFNDWWQSHLVRQSIELDELIDLNTHVRDGLLLMESMNVRKAKATSKAYVHAQMRGLRFRRAFDTTFATSDSSKDPDDESRSLPGSFPPLTNDIMACDDEQLYKSMFRSLFSDLSTHHQQRQDHGSRSGHGVPYTQLVDMLQWRRMFRSACAVWTAVCVPQIRNGKDEIVRLAFHYLYKRLGTPGSFEASMLGDDLPAFEVRQVSAAQSFQRNINAARAPSVNEGQTMHETGRQAHNARPRPRSPEHASQRVRQDDRLVSRQRRRHGQCPYVMPTVKPSRSPPSPVTVERLEDQVVPEQSVTGQSAPPAVDRATDQACETPALPNVEVESPPDRDATVSSSEQDSVLETPLEENVPQSCIDTPPMVAVPAPSLTIAEGVQSYQSCITDQVQDDRDASATVSTERDTADSNDAQVEPPMVTYGDSSIEEAEEAAESVVPVSAHIECHIDCDEMDVEATVEQQIPAFVLQSVVDFCLADTPDLAQLPTANITTSEPMVCVSVTPAVDMEVDLSRSFIMETDEIHSMEIETQPVNEEEMLLVDASEPEGGLETMQTAILAIIAASVLDMTMEDDSLMATQPAIEDEMLMDETTESYTLPESMETSISALIPTSVQDVFMEADFEAEMQSMVEEEMLCTETLTETLEPYTTQRTMQSSASPIPIPASALDVILEEDVETVETSERSCELPAQVSVGDVPMEETHSSQTLAPPALPTTASFDFVLPQGAPSLPIMEAEPVATKLPASPTVEPPPATIQTVSAEPLENVEAAPSTDLEDEALPTSSATTQPPSYEDVKSEMASTTSSSKADAKDVASLPSTVATSEETAEVLAVTNTTGSFDDEEDEEAYIDDLICADNTSEEEEEDTRTIVQQGSDQAVAPEKRPARMSYQYNE
ncbi:hypothetical protein QFC24_006607 [Naganishia onofrii]|uniref:Uncharacterized protein n=1 Tax=Naganishia onofrii TaxID=1851511 RepID=A0ACC2X0L1_9TREE|nr:hypothetical protein QFC24_006607 [Naganishia onofrii]